MLLKLIESGEQIDVILFCDTGLEFPAMYAHINKVEKEIGRKITRLRSIEGFEFYLLYKDVKNKEKTLDYFTDNGINKERMAGYSWPDMRIRWCTHELKDKPREKFFRDLRKKYNIIEYVGIAADESHRLKHKCNKNVRAPLVEWGMTEADCLDYCKKRGYDWGGLYEKYKRLSCWCCPLQTLQELRVLYRDFPDLWNQLKKWDAATRRDFRQNYSVMDLETRFNFEEEWKRSGEKIGTKKFFAALKNELRR